MEKKYELIAPFTLSTIFNNRDSWPEGFDFVFEDLLRDVINVEHSGVFESTDDLYEFTYFSKDEYEWFEKMGWIEELLIKENKKDIELTVGSTVKGISAYEEDEATYIYALVYGHPHSPKFNLVNIYTGGRYFEDDELGSSCTLGELNEKSSGLTTFIKLD
jgi:hypothetical protein